MSIGFNEGLAGGKQASSVCKQDFSLKLEFISVFHNHFECSVYSCYIDSFISVDFVVGNHFAHIFSMKMGNYNLPNPSAWNSASRNNTQMAASAFFSMGCKIIWGPQVLGRKTEMCK